MECEMRSHPVSSILVAAAALAALLCSCSGDEASSGGDSGPDADGDADADSDTDADTETTTDTGPGVPLAHTPMTGCGGGMYDPDNDLCWQNPASANATFGEVSAYCDDLDAGGHADWRLPTFSELRSLFRRGDDAECYSLEWDLEWSSPPEGICGVRDDCLELECGSGAECDPAGCGDEGGPGAGGCYWDPGLVGNCTFYWSSSPYETDEPSRWQVSFALGTVNASPEWAMLNARCVRQGP
jgi:hypothetical protein